MEQKLAEHERVEEKLKNEHAKKDFDKPSCEEKDKGPEVPEKEQDTSEKLRHIGEKGPQ